MSGSSRSLIKALEGEFSEWGENEEEVDKTELFEVIASFNEKHNTLQSIKSSIRLNDELVRIYNTYISPSCNLQKEILFVDVVTSLSPFFKREDTEFWLRTYLLPAVDSAGYDLKFISKSRDFIRRISIDIMHTEDAALKTRREEVSLKVMDYIMQICIQWTNPPDILDLNAEEDVKNTQEHFERLRFIKYNCTKILQEYSLARPNECFDLLNDFYRQADKRLEASVLLSDLISIEAPSCSYLSGSKLFHSLLECLHFDFSESVLSVSLNCLSMIIPHICSELSGYLPDLLHIHERMLCLTDIKKSFPGNVDLVTNIISEKQIKWHMLPFDRQAEIQAFTSISTKLAHDVQYLSTLLYALYPLNFKEYNTSPRKYFRVNRPKILNSFILETFNSMLVENYDPLQKTLESILKERTCKFLKGVLLHPKLIAESQSLEQELDSPLNWIIEEEGETFLGPEEIAIKCLGLNPFLEMSNSEQKALTEESTQDTNSVRVNSHATLGLHSFETHSNGNWDMMNLSPIDSRQISRVSSVGNTNILGSKEEHKSNRLVNQLLRQKSSLSSSVINDSTQDSEIRFKEVKFDKGIEVEPYFGPRENTIQSDSIDYIPRHIQDISADDSSLSSTDRKPSEPLNSLFQVHEKLFSPSKNDISSIDQSTKSSLGISGNTLNEKIRNDLHLQRPISSPTTSLETTQVHKDSNIASADSQNIKVVNVKDQSGSVLDFYHRELLLVKNELYFALYMRNLNKYYYTVLKLQLNNMIRNNFKVPKRGESNGHNPESEGMRQINENLSETLNHIKTQMDEEKSISESTINRLMQKLSTFKEENQKLIKRVSDLEAQNEVTSKSLDKLTNEVIISKNMEINNLKNKIEELQIDEEKVSKSSLAPKPESTPVTKGGADVSDWEEKIIYLKEELKLLNKKNEDLEIELKSAQSSLRLASQDYETKLNSSKLDIKDSLNSYILSYEKKIQELSSTIIKYEALLEEKNTRLLQLSSSRPLSIPRKSPDTEPIDLNGRPSINRTPADEIEESVLMNGERSNHSTNSSNSRSPIQTPIPNVHNGFQPNIFSPTPISAPANTRTNSQASLYHPIIKGRGGYQKRSRKHM